MKYRLFALAILQLLALAFSSVYSAEDSPIALYHFDEMQGDVVHDSSGFAPPIDLKISNTRRVRWHRDGLEVHSSVTLKNQPSTGRLENRFANRSS